MVWLVDFANLLLIVFFTPSKAVANSILQPIWTPFSHKTRENNLCQMRQQHACNLHCIRKLQEYVPPGTNDTTMTIMCKKKLCRFLDKGGRATTCKNRQSAAALTVQWRVSIQSLPLPPAVTIFGTCPARHQIHPRKLSQQLFSRKPLRICPGPSPRAQARNTRQSP